MFFHGIFHRPLCLDWILLGAFGLPALPFFWIYFKNLVDKSSSRQRNKAGKLKRNTNSFFRKHKHYAMDNTNSAEPQTWHF